MDTGRQGHEAKGSEYLGANCHLMLSVEESTSLSGSS